MDINPKVVIFVASKHYKYHVLIKCKGMAKSRSVLGMWAAWRNQLHSRLESQSLFLPLKFTSGSSSKAKIRTFRKKGGQGEHPGNAPAPDIARWEVHWTKLIREYLVSLETKGKHFTEREKNWDNYAMSLSACHWWTLSSWRQVATLPPTLWIQSNKMNRGVVV